MTKPDSARFVWLDRTGSGRNLYASFRMSFDISGTVKNTTLHLFADTYYKLFVNGSFIEYGPARFDPRFPLFDTHDLTAHLKPGRNTIAVLVNHFGMKTFKAMPARAGFVAWGSVGEGDSAVSFETRESCAWRCAPCRAYAYAPKMSFALNAGDRFDQALEEAGWTENGFDDSGWQQCVELERQDTWGALAPRSIPFMSAAEVPIKAVNAVLPLARHEDVYSFQVPAPNRAEIHSAEGAWWMAFQTWVYSPVAQTINAGTFWAEYWLNGTILDSGTDAPHKPMRRTQLWQLNEGWNHLGGTMKLYEDIAEMYFALPRERGLIMSADKNADSPVLFRRSRFYRVSEFGKPFPYSSDETLVDIGGWLEVTRGETGQSACRETSWDDYSEPFERVTPAELSGRTFRKSDYPFGFALLLDIDHMHLAFPRVRLSGVRGATVDLTYSEQLTPDNRHLEHSHNYQGGDRVRCTRDTVDFTPSHPKGMRYFKITVRNTSDDITFESLSLRAARYPVTYAGRFECSDQLLNEIWLMCRRTQAANMEDAYVDCSGRERGMYLRDTILQYYSNLAVFGDQALMRRCFQLYGQSPDSTGKFRAVYPNEGDYTIADFALNGLEGYHAYWAHSGDTDCIREDWGAMMNNLAWFHALADERKDMLLDAEWDKHRGISAHYGGFHGDLSVVDGHMDNTGIHCTFSCAYLIAMQRALELAQLIGATDDAAKLKTRIAVLKKSLQKFWDPKRNAFADNLKRKAHSIHANLFALRAGIATKTQLAAIREHVAHELRSIFVNGYDPSGGVLTSPNFAFYIFDGLYKAGLVETAQNMMRTGWGWALAQGMRTCPEYWRNHSSLCHAWSAGPAYYLSRYVLGVHYPEPGDIRKVAIAVKAEGIASASGAWPHPRGVVEVAWHMQRGKRVFDKVKAPRGVEIVSIA